jgi:hypothetical protein
MDVNSSVENAARLAAYKHAVDLGLTKQQSAHIAKNLTVNFNRKGEIGTAMNAFYLFYNAAIQGTATLWKASKSKKVQKVLAGIAVSSFLLAELNRSMSETDKDGENCYDKIPDWEKRRNLIVMNPAGECQDYFKFPLPYGYNVPYVFGENISATLHGRDKMKAAINMAVSMVDSFNPIGNADSENFEVLTAKMVSPTFTDPVVDLVANENFMGAPIMPEQRSFGPQLPDSQRYWGSVSGPSKWIAEQLNSLSGGSKYESGLIDVSPETLDHWRDFFTGGAGAFLGRLGDYPVHVKDRVLYDEEIPLHKVPFVRKFAGERTEYDISRSYYEKREEVKQIVGLYKKMKKEVTKENQQQVADYRRENKEILRLDKKLETINDNIKKINERISYIEEKDMGEAERRLILRDLRERKDKYMQRFSKYYNDAKKRAAED